MIELKRHGSYLETDNNGFVLPIANKALIQKEWVPIIDEIIEYYKKIFTDNLLSVYIRGSVAKGEAVPFISDLDSFCVVEKSMAIENQIKEEIDNLLEEKYPFCTHIEFTSVTKENVFKGFPPRKRGVWAELIKTQSVCVFGKDISNELEPFLLKDMIGHSYYIEKELSQLNKHLEEDRDSPNEIQNTCGWICRRIVRSGFDLVMLQEGKFTRDLFLCFETFSKFYPDKEDKMKAILNLSLNPISDIGKINESLNEICPWLISEINEKLKS